MRCGLLGKKLGHSYSPQIHSHLGSYAYELFEMNPEELSAFLTSEDFTGLNVTIPYKKDVIPYCAELTDTAKTLGAVNTIVRAADGKLIGHNTDLFGFSFMIKKSGLSLSGKKVLVLGSGGASATAVYAARMQGADVVVISRNGDNHYGNLHLHSDAAVIINATPVGMYPNNGVSPVDLANFPNLEGVLDMIYNPAKTELILQAEKRGLVAENGLWMLIAQAKESAEWFTGRKIRDEIILDIHTDLRKQMENIVLIGMPGCGKSSVGKLLAEKTRKTFVDADTEIERLANMPIPQIFATKGEAEFRRLETEVLRELGKKSGLIIATGGGCVTRQENYPLLHQNSKILWIQRNLNTLPTDGRPLSQATPLDELYRVRQPLYARFSDLTVDNNRDILSTVNDILSTL